MLPGQNAPLHARRAAGHRRTLGSIGDAQLGGVPTHSEPLPPAPALPAEPALPPTPMRPPEPTAPPVSEALPVFRLAAGAGCAAGSSRRRYRRACVLRTSGIDGAAGAEAPPHRCGAPRVVRAAARAGSCAGTRRTGRPDRASRSSDAARARVAALPPTLASLPPLRRRPPESGRFGRASRTSVDVEPQPAFYAPRAIRRQGMRSVTRTSPPRDSLARSCHSCPILRSGWPAAESALCAH
jgi:hypothetical protein